MSTRINECVCVEQMESILFGCDDKFKKTHGVKFTHADDCTPANKKINEFLSNLSVFRCVLLILHGGIA